MARGDRFGAGVHTFPFSVRLAVSVPLVLWNAWLMFELLMWSIDGDPRPAALFMVVLAPSLFMTIAFMQGLWRSRHEWLAARRDEDRAEFFLDDRLTWQPPERGFPIGTYDGAVGDMAEFAPEWTQPPAATLERRREMSISLTPLAIPLDRSDIPAPFAYPEPDESPAESSTEI